MTSSDGDVRERLSELWAAWGLTPSEAASQAQHDAVDAVAAWLRQGAKQPDVAIRAAQILLSDPEKVGSVKRPSWTALRRVLTEAWPNAGTLEEHSLYSQALLLAAWPRGVQEGALALVPLLRSAWDVMRGRQQQEEAISQWREEVSGALSPPNLGRFSEASPPAVPEIARFDGLALNSAAALQHVRTYQSQPQFNTVGPQLVAILQDHHAALEALGTGLASLSQEFPEALEGVATYAHAIVQEAVRNARNGAGELNLLWWGQARYCRALNLPYRRVRPDAAALWWTAREAAELSLSLEVEPAAAYLVETLRSLDQDVFEKRSLLRWMEELHGALTDANDKVPRLSDRLDAIAAGDALGLPVTWVRRLAARKQPLANASEAVALDLDAVIDRGQWASWMFRESILDLHLANNS
jgi:GTPase-associated system helical domain